MLIPDNGQPIMPPTSGTGVPDKALMASGTVPAPVQAPVGAAVSSTTQPPTTTPAPTGDGFKRYGQVRMNGQIVKAGQGKVFVVDPATNQIVKTEKVGASEDGGEPLKANELTDLTKKGAVDFQMHDVLDRFKPEYVGYMGNTAGEIDKIFKSMSNDPKNVDFTDWWSSYQAWVNQTRKDLFGSALTATEKPEFEKAIVSPRTSPAVAMANLQRQQLLAHNAVLKIAQAQAANGKSMAAISAATGLDIDEIKHGKPAVAIPTQTGIPQGAVDKLKSDPSLASHFDEKYGAGSAAKALGK